jgi:hypothetical protein
MDVSASTTRPLPLRGSSAHRFPPIRLCSTRAEEFENLPKAMQAGLREGGYDVGRNVAIAAETK